MRFVIQGLKYDTDKMKKIANVKKWYKTNSLLVKAIYGNEEVGTTYDCELWRSEKGNWLLTHTEDYNTKVGHAITKQSLKKYRKHRKSEPLLQRWGPKTIGVGTQQREYSTIYSVCKCGFSIYRKKPHWKGWFYMIVRIITIIAAVTAT